MTPSEFAAKIRSKYPGAYDKVDDETLARKVVEKYPQYADKVQFSATKEEKSALGKAWEMLGAPERLSSQGLNQIANAIPGAEPTGNMARDIALNTPKIAAETLAQTAPSFVSPAAILTAGAGQAIGAASKPLATVGKGVARQLEEMSGIAPRAEGALAAQFKDPTTFLAKKDAAAKLYEAAKAQLEKGANLFSGMYKPEEIIDAAKTYIAKGGVLEPSEALIYRKAIDKLAKSGRYIKDELISLRKEADAMAKASDDIAKADPAFVKGMRGEALRNVFPQNKLGGASPFKILVGQGMQALSAPLLSPMIQAGGATALGLGYRAATNPLLATGAGALLGFGIKKQRK